ncbi:MAG: four helix bundle protein [Candidatus Levybacteria bacterium CG_4_9_14_3_um_filter_35_16]|nr:MAG: four helix bundle protein [Candidatus Levybacteria bacterium CG22_combo_CG10-13_8_21_14_all_35_11]PJA91228.1 MAG: four helix bundle protein [Candidatus Levybacteria bacterium CG_4_9_14_3_um_filter_35_16]PJC54161.1 MAG: four helix bundle protein [Candidatus Levybacteria bacterium CG_4_9_14_0_2_um_filter_35_21]
MNKQNKKNTKFDLEERTARFAETIIVLCKKVQNNPASVVIISQLIRSATSIGANYCEANGASSKKDFRNKIFICKKEAIETKYWLRLLVKANESSEPLVGECKVLWQEAQELTLIFSKIAKSSE